MPLKWWVTLVLEKWWLNCKGMCFDLECNNNNQELLKLGSYVVIENLRQEMRECI